MTNYPGLSGTPISCVAFHLQSEKSRSKPPVPLSSPHRPCCPPVGLWATRNKAASSEPQCRSIGALEMSVGKQPLQRQPWIACWCLKITGKGYIDLCIPASNSGRWSTHMPPQRDCCFAKLFLHVEMLLVFDLLVKKVK